SATYTRAAGETVAGNPYHITASLSASVAGALDNYTITNAGADFTINKRLATWTTDASSKTYGDADPSPLTSGSGNFLAADGVSATYTRAAGETVAGNPYHITASLSASVAGALDNYTITNAGADFTINKRLATWTTDASSKTYGDADPSPLTSGSGNFLAADGVSATYTRTAGETVASNPYHITATLSASVAGALDNYTITNAGADFTINKRLATWTTDASSKAYGDADPSPLTSGSGDFLAADGVSATYTRAAGETVAGNPYHITASLSASIVGALDNYTITNAGADFTINKRLATWTTIANNKYCGQLDPSPLTTGSGNFLAADGVSATYTRAAGETVAGNPYHITSTLSASVAGALNNYTITNVGADFTINGITSIDASASSMAYPLGTPDTVRATITPNVAGVTVYFHLDNGSGGIYDVSGVTDASGKAQYIWPLGLPVEVYKVTAVAGSGCASTTSAAYLSIYDPNGGFVTGGGWINSPEGAYYANTSLSGRANFGFNSKYKKGSQIPDGNTEFQFQTGNLNFSSISYSSGSLVIAGSQAIYKGVGTINGTTGYSFMVSAIDGQYNGGTGSDKFRIKIWNTSSGAKVYDNMLGVDDNATLDPLTTAIGGGSIVIQNAATKKAAAVRLEPNLITSTDLEVSASPSITSNFFTLTIKSARTEKIAARVFDVNGRTVELLKPVVGERQQFGHSYNGGMYFVEVLQGNQRKMVKLVKQ
ncbi:MAG: MBG domain-containing protein, partial [Bacteroidota bacterium]